MDQQLSLITLAVEDLERSRDFYVRGLGWQPILDLDEITFFQVGHGVALALFPSSSLAEDIGVEEVGVEARSAAPSGFTLAHNVDGPGQVDAVYAEAVRAGATELKAPQRADFGGYHAYFADPDGIRWEVCHNPGLTVAADGTVVIAPVPD